MEETLRALGGILLKAIPTFILVLLLYVYLARVFFRPMQEILKKRYEATEGARKLADEALAKAAAKTEEYEAAMRAARAGVYHDLSEMRRQLHAERATAMEQTRQQSEAQIGGAKAELENEVAGLKRDLAGESEALASQIAEQILRRRAV